MTDNDHDTQKRTVHEDSLGSRQVTLDGVNGAAVSVKTPNIFTDEQIGVAGYAYDDREGQVQLTLGSEVRVGVTLDASDARELAERIGEAADEAEAKL